MSFVLESIVTVELTTIFDPEKDKILVDFGHGAGEYYCDLPLKEDRSGMQFLLGKKVYRVLHQDLELVYHAFSV